MAAGENWAMPSVSHTLVIISSLMHNLSVDFPQCKMVHHADCISFLILKKYQVIIFFFSRQEHTWLYNNPVVQTSEIYVQRVLQTKNLPQIPANILKIYSLLTLAPFTILANVKKFVLTFCLCASLEFFYLIVSN